MDRNLITERRKAIEDDEVRSAEEVLLDSIPEFTRPRRWLPPICMIPDCGCIGEAHP